jgi:hypothetical protein
MLLIPHTGSTTRGPALPGRIGSGGPTLQHDADMANRLDFLRALDRVSGGWAEDRSYTPHHQPALTSP